MIFFFCLASFVLEKLGKNDLKKRDIWALGCIFYEIYCSSIGTHCEDFRTNYEEILLGLSIYQTQLFLLLEICWKEIANCEIKDLESKFNSLNKEKLEKCFDLQFGGSQSTTTSSNGKQEI